MLLNNVHQNPARCQTRGNSTATSPVAAARGLSTSSALYDLLPQNLRTVHFFSVVLSGAGQADLKHAMASDSVTHMVSKARRIGTQPGLASMIRKAWSLKDLCATRERSNPRFVGEWVRK